MTHKQSAKSPARKPAAPPRAAAKASARPKKRATVKSSSDGGEANALVPAGASSVDQLLSGKVIAPRVAAKKTKKSDRAAEKLPGELAHLGDILVAGRKILREIDFKVRFAEERVKEFCLKRFCERFAESGQRPESVKYAAENSVFTFIQTRKITLTPEKAEALKMMNIPVENHTELKGIHVNFAAIKEHKLEVKLRDALAAMGVKQSVLLECFQPDVQLKESFFAHLSAVVNQSLKKGEDLTEKLYEVTRLLHPAEQIRNAESPNLGPIQAFKLIHDTKISVTEDLDALED
jgi:hypothetical protein